MYLVNTDKFVNESKGEIISHNLVFIILKTLAIASKY